MVRSACECTKGGWQLRTGNFQAPWMCIAESFSVETSAISRTSFDSAKYIGNSSRQDTHSLIPSQVHFPAQWIHCQSKGPSTRCKNIKRSNQIRPDCLRIYFDSPGKGTEMLPSLRAPRNVSYVGLYSGFMCKNHFLPLRKHQERYSPNPVCR